MRPKILQRVPKNFSVLLIFFENFPKKTTRAQRFSEPVKLPALIPGASSEIQRLIIKQITKGPARLSRTSARLLRHLGRPWRTVGERGRP